MSDQNAHQRLLKISGLCRSYGDLAVLKSINLTVRQDVCCCLMAPSGSGKTTLFRILMGLERPDSGSVTVENWTPSPTGSRRRFPASSEAETGASSFPLSALRVSAVFQEDRLCESFTPVENVMLTAGGLREADCRREMSRLLPAECLSRPVSTLSGGMKRRTALLRALLAPSDLLLLDEPFTGLDEETKRLAIRFLLERRGDRFLLVATHQEEDAALLGGETVHLADLAAQTRG